MLEMPKGQREQSLVLVCILALAAVGLYWYLVFSPGSEELALKRERVEAMVATNKKAKAEMAKGDLDDLRRELAQYRKNLALVRTLVPVGNEVPLLLEQVSTAARRTGLEIAMVDPYPVIEGSNYDTYRYGMTVVGGYHELAQFFTNVGSLTRIVLPMNVSLQLSRNANAQKLPQREGAAVIEARFQLQTFVTHTPDGEDRDVSPTRQGAKS